MTQSNFKRKIRPKMASVIKIKLTMVSHFYTPRELFNAGGRNTIEDIYHHIIG